jgi:hypothetical protein
MDEDVNSWFDAALEALAPAEREGLASPEPGEGRVAHLIRIARNSRRAKAREMAITALHPAARDRLPGVVDTAIALLEDAGKYVRYRACQGLAVAMDSAAMPALEAARSRGLEVPYDGLAGAIRAIERQDRNAFFDHYGTGSRTTLVLQDERSDFKPGGTHIVIGSAAYGTARRS